MVSTVASWVQNQYLARTCLGGPVEHVCMGCMSTLGSWEELVQLVSS